MKDKKTKIGIIILLLLTMISIYLISSSYMMAPDEYNYSHIAWTNIKLSSIKDIITSQISMYNQWTGRVPVHTTIQVLLYLGTWIYEIINPIIFAIFILLISIAIFKNFSYFKVILTTFLICFGIKCFGEKFIWLSGSVNYLWTTVLMLIMIITYYNMFEKNREIKNKEILPFFILSFISGWTQENVVFVLGTFIAIIGLINIKKFIKFDKKKKIIIISSIILFGLGVILLIFAPGNFSRMSTNETKFQIVNILKNLFGIKYLILVYLITIMALIFTKYKRDNQNQKINIWKNQILFISVIAIALIPMTIIAEFPERAMLPYETILILLIVSNSQYIIENLELKKIVIIVSILLTILTGYKFIRNISVAQKYMKPYKEKIAMEINLAKIRNEKEVILSRFEEANVLASKNINMLVDFSPKAFNTNIINAYMATYYNFDSLEAIGDNEYIVKIYLNKDIENLSYDIINFENGEKVRDCLYDSTVSTTNTIKFIILKSELGKVKIKLPNEIKANIQKIELQDILQKQEIEKEKVLIY